MEVDHQTLSDSAEMVSEENFSETKQPVLGDITNVSFYS